MQSIIDWKPIMVLSVSDWWAVGRSMHTVAFQILPRRKTTARWPDRLFRSSFDKLRTTGSGLTDLFLLRVSWLLNADGTYLMHVGDSGQHLFNAILLQGTHAFVECVSQ